MVAMDALVVPFHFVDSASLITIGNPAKYRPEPRLKSNTAEKGRKEL